MTVTVWVTTMVKPAAQPAELVEVTANTCEGGELEVDAAALLLEVEVLLALVDETDTTDEAVEEAGLLEEAMVGALLEAGLDELAEATAVEDAEDALVEEAAAEEVVLVAAVEDAEAGLDELLAEAAHCEAGLTELLEEATEEDALLAEAVAFDGALLEAAGAATMIPAAVTS